MCCDIEGMRKDLKQAKRREMRKVDAFGKCVKDTAKTVDSAVERMMKGKPP